MSADATPDAVLLPIEQARRCTCVGFVGSRCHRCGHLIATSKLDALFPQNSPPRREEAENAGA